MHCADLPRVKNELVISSSPVFVVISLYYSWMKNTHPLFLLNVLFSVLGHPSPVALAVVVYWNAFRNVINALLHTGLAAVRHTQQAFPVAFFLHYGRPATRFLPQIWMRLPRKPRSFKVFLGSPKSLCKRKPLFSKTTLGAHPASHFSLMKFPPTMAASSVRGGLG